MRCRRCKNANLTRARFCARCGARISTARPALVGIAIVGAFILLGWYKPTMLVLALLIMAATLALISCLPF